MPEGDTIHRHARRLRPVLVGHRADLVMPRLATPAPTPVLVEAVRVHGKHLLVDLDPDDAGAVVLHVHLGMPGRWDVTRPAPSSPPRGRDLRVALTTSAARATCRRAPVAELLAPGRARRHRVLGRLGPDLAGEVDLDEVVARVRERPVRPLHVTLLDQGVAAGLGNVLAVEACHEAGLDPRTPTDALADGELRDVYDRGRRELVANIDRVRRTTVPGARPGALWVYGRDGRPCRRCGTDLVATSLGGNARHVTWCPSCQPSRAR